MFRELPKPAWIRKVWRGLRLLPRLPGRIRSELAALRHMQAELSRLVARTPTAADWTAWLTEHVHAPHAQRMQELAGELQRRQVEQMGQLTALQQLHQGHAQQVAGLTAQVAELATALQRVSAEYNAQLFAQTRQLAEWIGGAHADALKQTAAMLQRERAEYATMLTSVTDRRLGEMQEWFALLEHVGRQGRRAAAEAALRQRHPAPTERSEGLSILIPCWNQGPFLGDAVASALESLDGLAVAGEVIIFDDGSRDASRRIAHELMQSDRRVRLLASDENVGLPRARNCLLSQARHQHALLLDADNKLIASGVAALYEAARQTEAVLVYGTLAVIDEAGQLTGVVSHERVTPRLLEGNWIDALALVRTERLLELGGYDTDAQLPAWEDYELNVRLLHRGERLAHVPTLVALYRCSPLSMNHELKGYTERRRRMQRIYGLKGPLSPQKVCASIYHPATGYLWRSPAWSDDDNPSLALSALNAAPAAPRILVIGSGGLRNHGDDAILLSTLQRLQRIRPGIIPLVVSDGAEVPPLGRLGVWAATVQELCQALDPVLIREGCRDRLDGNELATQVGATAGPNSFVPVDWSELDVILFAGGGNLTDNFPDIASWRTAIAATARAQGIPYIVSGQGVGPLTAATEAMVTFLAEGAVRFGVRDPFSADCLRRLLNSSVHVEVVGDDSLGLATADPAEVDELLREIGVSPEMPLLGFHARQACYVGCSPIELLSMAEQVD